MDMFADTRRVKATCSGTCKLSLNEQLLAGVTGEAQMCCYDKAPRPVSLRDRQQASVLWDL